jgi:flagellar protein FlaI
MFEAMHTGHSVYATMHADNVEQVKRRLIEPPIAIPKAEIEALHLILIQYRDRRKSIRRTLELAEVLIGREDELSLNYLYRWQPRTDTFVRVNESIRVQEELNLHTGKTPKELNEDLKQKQEILDWMLRNNLKDVNVVGRIMRYYYKEKDVLLDWVSKNKKPDILQP